MMNADNVEAVIKDTIEYANNEIRKNKKRSRRIVAVTLTSAILIIALLASCFMSYVKFNTRNPFFAVNGYLQVAVLGKEYIQIQNSPKVMLAQPSDEIFINYMKSRGFTEIEDEQMGGMRVFSNGSEKEWILYSINEHYSKWCWQ